ncbi:MAG: type I-B CRISPR-associated protein Cas8b1/Cst1, partial [Candidatus Omnitrophica bacterium]|nr:type I-B CRISPR-associated protein Cas8b1/Cst1 [Candidatus Omnitrophota bacterium]
MNNNQKITLYPSNWLYNAGVIGFLRVLEFGSKLNDNIFDESNIVVNREWIKESYDLIFKYHKEKFSIWGKNRRYPNYIQLKHKNFFEREFIPSLVNVVERPSAKICGWCGGFFLPDNILENLRGTWTGRSSNGFERFMEQREKFQAIHISELGGAITEMPNSFWNLNFSMPLCHLCSYLIIFHHLSFIKGEKNTEIFINTPHFYLTWDLNKFAEEILQKEYELRKLLGASFIQWAIKRRTLLGAWTMMNIEVIIKKWHK